MGNHKDDNRRYKTFNYPGAVPGSKTLLTGIRGVKKCDKLGPKVYISGFYEAPEQPTISFIYKGYLNGKGKWYELNYPSSEGVTVTSTSLYGPNNGPCTGTVQVVGNFITEQSGTSALGCLYEGELDGFGKWTTLIPTSLTDEPILNTIAHSTMGELIVGNYDTQLNQGKAFIYDIKRKIYHNIDKPNAKSITAYGIWYNSRNSYTICGGFSDLDFKSGVDASYLVDWNNKTYKFSNWRTYYYDNDPIKAVITHFDGITSDGSGGYNLTGDWLGVGEGSELGFFAHVKRNKHCGFGKAKWEAISFPGQPLTSGNSVYEDTVIGVYTSPDSELDMVNGYISLKK